MSTTGTAAPPTMTAELRMHIRRAISTQARATIDYDAVEADEEVRRRRRPEPGTRGPRAKCGYRGDLTKAVWQALLGAAIGESNPETGARLGRSGDTVRGQLATARGILGASNTGEAVRIAFRTELITWDDILDAIGRHDQEPTRG